MFISPGQQRLRCWFAPACPCIPTRDNSIVSRSGRRRYGIRKLVWSCQDRSRSSLICPYHTVLQHSFPTTALHKTPKAWGQRLRCSCTTLATLPAVLPAIQGFLRDPKMCGRRRESVKGNLPIGAFVLTFSLVDPGWGQLLPLKQH